MFDIKQNTVIYGSICSYIHLLIYSYIIQTLYDGLGIDTPGLTAPKGPLSLVYCEPCGEIACDPSPGTRWCWVGGPGDPPTPNQNNPIPTSSPSPGYQERWYGLSRDDCGGT